jgi:hypothetical protein
MTIDHKKVGERITTEKFGIAEESTSESLVLRECQSGGAYRPIGLSTVLEMVLDILEPTDLAQKFAIKKAIELYEKS